MKFTRQLFSFPTMQWAIAATIAGGLAIYLIPPAATASYLHNLTIQQDAQQEEGPDQPAPPPRPGRKKFGGLKRGRVVQANPNMAGLAASPGNRSVSRWVKNGSTNTSLKTDDREIKVEQSDLGIFIHSVQTFDRSDLPMLEKKDPKLADAIKAFPNSSDGAQLDVSVASTKRYEAANLQQLEEDKPEAFALYQEVMAAYDQQAGFANGPGVGRANFGAPGFNNQAFQFGGAANFGGEMDEEFQQHIQEMQQRFQEHQKEMQQRMQESQKRFEEMKRNMRDRDFQFNFNN